MIRLDDGPPGARRTAVRTDHRRACRRQSDDAFVKSAFRLLRAAGPALEQSAAPGGAAFLTVSRLEGTFGLTGLSAASSPAAGALAGMAKTAGHEWQGVHCKAVDLAPGFDSPARLAGLDCQRVVRARPDRSRPEPRGPNRAWSSSPSVMPARTRAPAGRGRAG